MCLLFKVSLQFKTLRFCYSFIEFKSSTNSSRNPSSYVILGASLVKPSYHINSVKIGLIVFHNISNLN